LTPHRALPYPTAVPERSLLGAWCERNFLKRRLVLALDAPTRSAPSLDLYELVMELEDTYGIKVSEEEAGEIRTVGEAVDFVIARLSPG